MLLDFTFFTQEEDRGGERDGGKDLVPFGAHGSESLKLTVRGQAVVHLVEPHILQCART